MDRPATTSPFADMDAALAAAHDVYRARNPKSLAQVERAAASMPGGNTRTVLHYPPFPLTIARGAGSRLWDLDGHAYVDLLGEYTAGIYGHSHPTILAAIRAALDDGLSLGGHNMIEAQLAQAIVARFPSIDLVRFTNSGTEANLMAVGLAKAFTGRTHVVAARGGYHGGAMTLAYPASPLNAPFPYVLVDYNDAQGAADAIGKAAGDVAAIIVEPMMGSGGCLPATAEFLAMLRAEATRIGAILIFDEVMTSRLSPGGIQPLVGVEADLTTLGKYLGGGSSFGAFGGRADIMALFDPRRSDALPHAGTFNNNVISMAAGLAGLTQVYTPAAAEALNQRGESLRARLNQICAAHAAPLQFTGIGSLMNAHATGRPIRTPADIQSGDMKARDLLFHHLLAEGIYAARRGFVALSLAVSDPELDAYVAAVDGFLERYGRLMVRPT